MKIVLAAQNIASRMAAWWFDCEDGWLDEFIALQNSDLRDARDDGSTS